MLSCIITISSLAKGSTCATAEPHEFGFVTNTANKPLSRHQQSRKVENDGMAMVSHQFARALAQGV